jgi:hypothetical protein
MKVTTIIKSFSAVIATALLAVSCVKETGMKTAATQLNYSNKAYVQVYNATLSSTRNYVYVDGNAVTGAAVAYAATFPSTPSLFTVTSGTRVFLIKDTLLTSTQPPMSFAEGVEAGRYYTIFMYDTVNAAKHKTVTNNIVIPSDTTSRVRFANFAYSPFAIPAIDIFSVKRNANIFSNVSTTEVTEYIPFASSSKTVENDTLYVRIAGSGVNLMNRTVTTSGTPPVTVTTFSPVQIIVAPTRLRSYTLIFRGGWRTDLTTAATVRALSFFSGN